MSEFENQGIPEYNPGPLGSRLSRRALFRRGAQFGAAAVVVTHIPDLSFFVPQQAQASELTQQIPVGGYRPADQFSLAMPEPGHYERAAAQTESGSYHPGGRGLEAILRRFGDAHYYATEGEDERDRIEKTFIAMLDNGAGRLPQGICNGRAAFQVLKWGPTPESGILGGMTFSRADIAALGGILHFGDAHGVESKGSGRAFTTGEKHSAIFLDYMVRKYIFNETAFVFDASPLASETWTYPADRAGMTRRSVGGGWTEVDLTLTASDYAESGGGRKDFGFVYRIKEDDLDNPGQIIRGADHFKSAYYPDPTRWLVINGRSYRVRGNTFTQSMVNTLNSLSGGIMVTVPTR